MNMAATFTVPGELGFQAQVAMTLGSRFVAAVLEAGERQLYRAPLTAQLIETWPEDRSASALAMRFNAALHTLARGGKIPALAALYRGEHDDYDGAIGAAIEMQDAFIAAWMHDTPQTNEVGRAGAIAAALMVVGSHTGMPFELLELGSSCGLNLNLARYAYNLGGVLTGDQSSAVRVAPTWHGPPPIFSPIDVVSARGSDLNPLSANDDAARERLLSYVWADQPERAARLTEALDLALLYPPRVDQENGVTWLAARLAEPQREGVCRVVFHSMVAQYMARADRQMGKSAIYRAGALATIERPFAWVTFEWTPMRNEVQLWLTCWPGRKARKLAICHAYGQWIDWLG